MAEEITDIEDMEGVVDEIREREGANSDFFAIDGVEWEPPEEDELVLREKLMSMVFDKDVGTKGRLHALKELRNKYHLVSVSRHDEIMLVLEEAIHEEEAIES